MYYCHQSNIYIKYIPYIKHILYSMLKSLARSISNLRAKRTCRNIISHHLFLKHLYNTRSDMRCGLLQQVLRGLLCLHFKKSNRKNSSNKMRSFVCSLSLSWRRESVQVICLPSGLQFIAVHYSTTNSPGHKGGYLLPKKTSTDLTCESSACPQEPLHTPGFHTSV